jgi:hypothetical protein
MDKYDPMAAPDPDAWLALDESERIDLVEDFHTRHRIDLPNSHLHAIAHAVVENQIAADDPILVRVKLRQLLAQGLDRHDAVHAIGSVIMGHLTDIAAGRVADADPNRRYGSALRRLTARQWLRAAGR